MKYRSQDIDILLLNVAANLLNQNLSQVARDTQVCASTIKRYRDLEVKRPSAHVLFVLADYYGIKVQFKGLIQGLQDREQRLRIVTRSGFRVPVSRKKQAVRA